MVLPGEVFFGGLNRFIGRDFAVDVKISTLEERLKLEQFIPQFAITLWPSPPVAGSGYTDGYSLYESYFVPDKNDPTGLKCPILNRASKPDLHFNWAVRTQHEQTFDFKVSCPKCCKVDTDSIRIDVSGVWSCMTTRHLTWIVFLQRIGQNPWTEDEGPRGGHNISDLKEVEPPKCDGSQIKVTWYARTRLASHFYVFADSCWKKAKMTYKCVPCEK